VREALNFLELARSLGLDALSPRAQELLWSALVAHPDAAPLLQPLAAELGFARRVTEAAQAGDNSPSSIIAASLSARM
jgi:hypothetical protein